MLPLSTFNYPDSDWLAYPPPPWSHTGEKPIHWIEKNIHAYLYAEKFIEQEAVPYAINQGPNASGIYFLLHSEEIFYVGKSVDIRSRLIQHWDKGWDIQRYWCFGGIPEIFIEEIEAFYIHVLEPELNIKYPILSGLVGPLVQLAKENQLIYKDTLSST